MRALLDRTSEAVALRFARFVAHASDKRLARLMRPPLRGVILKAVFASMPQRFDPSKAPGTTGILEFRITKPGGKPPTRHQLQVADDKATTRRGGKDEPSVSLELTPANFLRLVTGATTAPDLYADQAITIEGNLMTGVVISALLPDARSMTTNLVFAAHRLMLDGHA